MQHKEQRVLVLFDVQNLYYSAKHLYNTKVNFKEILKKAVSGRKLIRAIAYVIRADIKDEYIFHEALEKIGIEVKAKDLQIFFGGAKKGDWDIGIAMDAVRMVNKVDTVVLISGDGDFKDLCAYLKSHGCRTEALAFTKTASKHLKEEADMFYDLSLDLKKYLIGTPKVTQKTLSKIDSPKPREDKRPRPIKKADEKVKTDKSASVSDDKSKAAVQKDIGRPSARRPSTSRPSTSTRRPSTSRPSTSTRRPPRKDHSERTFTRNRSGPMRSDRPRRTDRYPARAPRDFSSNAPVDEMQNAILQANMSQPEDAPTKPAKKEKASVEVIDMKGKEKKDNKKSLTGAIKKLISKKKEE